MCCFNEIAGTYMHNNIYTQKLLSVYATFIWINEWV